MSEHRSYEPGEPAGPQDPELPHVSSEESDEGWGDDARDGRRDEHWYRRERPPHHQ